MMVSQCRRKTSSVDGMNQSVEPKVCLNFVAKAGFDFSGLFTRVVCEREGSETVMLSQIRSRIRS